MLVLSEREIQSLIDIEELTKTLEQAHLQYSAGKAVMPVRLVVPLRRKFRDGSPACPDFWAKIKP
jgi:ornithine cyclodeaminase/alanine dehydrogenase-like protein (mu-crystallin family)